MNVAIYPRKSKANDNSQSMEQQIADCQSYIEQNYPDANIFVYGGDYALTGHTTTKRKDFQRMMEDVRAKRIQLVVIMRYDRIARNMRDFCNLFHDMEQNGCNLVSVSQQIDTSTPYGKNFMYQMAAMAELEWAIISERYKDTAKYKREHGYAYTGRVSYGYKIEKQADGFKRVVKNPDKNPMIIFDHYRKTRNKSKTVEYIRENYDPKFTYDILRKMLESDMYLGKVDGNDNFCEPYLTEQELEELRNIKIVKATKNRRTYLFSKLIKCPECGRHFDATSMNQGKSKGYRCGYYRHIRVHKDIYLTEWMMEQKMLACLEPILDDKIIKASICRKKKNKSSTGLSQSLTAQLERLNYLFEKGRISVEDYEQKYSEVEQKIAQLKAEQEQNFESIKKSLPSNWKDIYSELDEEHRQSFWQQIVSEIIVDQDKNIIDISFV